jgi:ABC-type branched-subunit amino acid transport system substrate-binding protein
MERMEMEAKQFSPAEKDAIMAKVAADLTSEAGIDALVAYYESNKSVFKDWTDEEFKEYMRDYGFMVVVGDVFNKYENDPGEFFHNDEIMSRFNKMLDAAFAAVYPKFLVKIGK